VPLDVVVTAYGRPALLALRRAVAAAKQGDPLAPVTVIVPANHVGVTARRALASGSLGPVSDGGAGVAAVTFLTVYRLAELLGAARLAAEQRRPVSTPVLAAALRKVLRREPGLFAPVAEHPATEAALVAAFGELSDISADGLEALAAAGHRPGDVVRLCRQARAVIRGGWYDEADLTEAAVDAVRSEPARVRRELGHVVVHLPQDLLQRQARLVAAVTEACTTTLVVGVTGVGGADAGVRRSLARLGVDAPATDAAAAPTPSGTTRVLTASDADDEVRAAVRAVVDAARGGIPLERIAILYGTREPYGRLVHEHLEAAGVTRNGAAVRPLAGSVPGRTLLDLLALPDHDFRRADVVGLLSRSAGGGPGSVTESVVRPTPSRGGGRGSGRRAPTAEWQRVSRQAGVVAGRDQWSQRLERLAAELDRRAGDIEVTGTDPFDETGAERRREAFERLQRRAQRVRDLAAIVVGLIDDITAAGVAPKPWSTRVRWLRRLAVRLIGDGGQRADWPRDDLRAADRVEAALERLASLDGIDDPPSLEVFRRTLELELDADLGRVGRFGEGVLVGPLSFAVGLDLDLVIVLGMAEGTLPAAVHDDSLLPDGERRLAGGELPLRRDRVGREQRRLLAALAAADRHLLCAPRGDLRSSSERVLSRWLVDLPASSPAPGGEPEHVPSFAHAVTHTEFPATEQEYRLRAGAGGDPVVEAGSRVVRARRSRDFTRFDGNLAGVVVPSPLDEVVSSTRLESWAECPFAYFVGHLLHVEPVEDPARQLTISAWDRGSLVHEILQSFIDDVLARPVERRPAPDQPWSEIDHGRMCQIAERVCDDYAARGLTGRAVFWRRERAQILALADRFLADDDSHRQRDRSRPVAAELRFGYGDDPDGPGPVVLPLADGRNLRFRGAADRVDVGDDGTIHVVDYKTGKADDFRRLGPDNPDERGTKLQLPVYGLAARQFVGRPEAPVQAHYWFISDREGFRRIGYAVDDQVLARVGATLATIVDGIERGAFPARPDASGTPWVTCPFCDPDGLGVSDLRRAWERKRNHPAIAAYAEMAEP
jgi:RecB family exonuclease